MKIVFFQNSTEKIVSNKTRQSRLFFFLEISILYVYYTYYYSMIITPIRLDRVYNLCNYYYDDNEI